MNTSKWKIAVLAGLGILALAGCVERTIAIRSVPPGALVTVNEVEKGRTPLTFPFTWYGDYRVRIEQPDYKPLETHRAVSAPIYQWPVLDFISEVLLPFKFHDQHDWTFTLTEQGEIPTGELIERAKGFRAQAQTAPEHDVWRNQP